jgi:hypothetical protein
MSNSRSVRSIHQRKHYFYAFVIAVASIGSLLPVGSARSAEAAASTEKFGDMQQAIAELRQEAGQDRRAIVKANMLLTNSEATLFWPLYDEYRGEREKIGDRKVKVITDYLAKRDSMTQDEATELTKEYLSVQKDTVDLKEDFYKKMSKTLSPRTVSRFFQIDQKLDAATDLVLASKIPLIH